MILIVGGFFQGKAAFARSLCEKRECVETGFGKSAPDHAVDGSMDDWQQAMENACLLNFHGFLRQVMEAGLSTDSFTEKVLERQPEIVTMDEVGSGIVPMERADRDYREAVGRAGQLLAAEAEAVYRMVCGIPVRIK